MRNLEGKVALVTGASGGIGRAIAQRFAQEGALVAVHYGKNREAALKTVRIIEEGGGAAFPVGADLGRVQGVKQLYDSLDAELLSRTGKTEVDLLVNNAGIALFGTVDNTEESDFDAIFAVNVKGPFYSIQHALPRMREQGRIINISSAVTRIAIPDVTAYSMTKGAINTLTLALAKQLAPRGITVNAILPGFVATDMNAAMLQDPDSRKIGADFSAFGRWGEPQDIADIAGYLASPDSRWITGQLIDASGGSHL
ncbi:short-chain dehydrogenase [Paenibacillus swuensis]|uniref:Short-chain dehydrogenase n=1 Tax=Paenibacillus swuensis TaxID=1178515 RepID=A0A172TNP4_9BACL|nr:SDR family oxidoreductase [Paenibacillus swuensis]ANE48709.1 short-chain dehydrogenase [Paenibacillus swuensis]